MRKRPSILSVYRICVSRPCQHSRPYTTSVIFLLHVRPLLHIRPILTGLKLLPQHPRCVNVARNVARGVSRGVGRMRQYEHLTGAGSPPLIYISHNLPVEMGDFTDNWNTLNALHSDNLKNLSHTTKNKLYVACTRARSNIYFISLSFLEKYKKE